ARNPAPRKLFRALSWTCAGGYFALKTGQLGSSSYRCWYGHPTGHVRPTEKGEARAHEQGAVDALRHRDDRLHGFWDRPALAPLLWPEHGGLAASGGAHHCVLSCHASGDVSNLGTRLRPVGASSAAHWWSLCINGVIPRLWA